MLGRQVSDCGKVGERMGGKGVVLVLSILVMAIGPLCTLHNAQIFKDLATLKPTTRNIIHI